MAYPASVEFTAPERVANWRPLIHWFLAIPHVIIAVVLGIVANVLTLLSWFIIIFAGRLPKGIASFQVMHARYRMRVSAYMGFMHGQYPKFRFSSDAIDPGDAPIAVHIESKLDDRSRLSTFFRPILVIPVAIFFAIVAIIAGIAHLIAFFAVLFTGRWPAGLLSWIVGALNLITRIDAYVRLLVDKYPPFRLRD